jgi:hypothetical protein
MDYPLLAFYAFAAAAVMSAVASYFNWFVRGA